MKDKRVLVVSSEVVPYLPENELSITSFETAKMIHGKYYLQCRIMEYQPVC